jgi:hypothetical protein
MFQVARICGTSLVIVGCSLAAAAAQIAPSTSAITGQVVDQRGGTPLADAVVQIPQLKSSVVTDENGRFTFHAVPAGTYRLTVSIVGYILATRDITVTADRTVDVMIPLAEGTGTYREDLTVRGDMTTPAEAAVAAQHTLGSAELQNLRGVMLDDPLRAVQALPGVSATDDLHGVFTVRGSGLDHLGFTLNGVPTKYVLHTVEAVEGGGSTAMINADVLDRVSLMAGAYPQRVGGRLGALLEFELRQGSRDRQASRLAISGSSVAFTSEGPLGSDKRGSWLVSGRKSYLDFLFEQVFDDPTFTFGFEDVQAYLVRDVGGRHQLRATLMGGQSRFNEQGEDPGPNDLFQARLNGWLAGIEWRYVDPRGVVISQQGYSAGGRYRNVNRDRFVLSTGAGRHVGYRADVTYAASTSALVEAGGNVTEATESASGQDVFDESRIAFGGYAQARLSPSSRIVIVPGARFDRWATVRRMGVSPWLNAEWRLTDSARVVAGTGVHRQAPRFAQVFGRYRSDTLVPEKAEHIDAAIEYGIGAGLQFRLGGYVRRERNVIDLTNRHFRMIGGRVVPPASSTTFGNNLDGRARGVELSLRGSGVAALTGWIAYSLGRVDYTDRDTGEEFAGDFDERHNVSANATWRLSNRTTLTTKFRASSNFPLPGYFRQEEESFGGAGFRAPVTMTAYYVGDRRNQVRLPAYSRLDVRANRTYTWEERRLTLFLEVTNIYNRANQRYTGGNINGRTGRVSDLTEDLFPILPSAGLLIEF